MADTKAEVRVAAVCNGNRGCPSLRPSGVASRSTPVEMEIEHGRTKPCPGGNWRCGCNPCPCNPCLCAPSDEVVPGDDKE